MGEKVKTLLPEWMLERQFVKAFILLFLFCAYMAGVRLIDPPYQRSKNTPDQFHTARALGFMTQILGAQKPHPVGSQENDHIRERLMDQIEMLGFEPQVTSGLGCNLSEKQRFGSCALTHNVSFYIGPKPRPGDKDTILVASHYDSVPAGPGAADAMMGVGVILEVATHLAKIESERPILFLITDGEEAGLLGAHAFVDHDPRANEIDVVVNLEARGVLGPVFMFETSQPNGTVIPAFMKGVKRPAANSMMAGIYERLPNSTDVSVFLNKGMKALNFAIIGNESFYHTPKDNLENISARSVQHMGDQILATVKALSRKDHPQFNGRLIYTDIVSRGMITMPQILALPILFLSLMMAVGGFFVASKSTPKGTSIWISVGVLFLPLLIALTGMVLSYGIEFIISTLRIEPDYWRAHSWASRGYAIMSALMALVFLPGLLARKANRGQIYTASWIWFILAGCAMALIIPGAMILFVVPAILFCISIIVRLTFTPALEFFEALAALVTLSIWVAPVAAIGEGLGYSVTFVISLICAITLLPWLGILVGNHDKVKENTAPDRFLTKPALMCTLLFAASSLLTLVLPAYSDQRPRHLNVLTIQDGDKTWHTFGSNPTPLPKEMVAGLPAPERGVLIAEFRSKIWHIEANSEAPLVAMAKPDLEKLSLRKEDGVTHGFKMLSNGSDRTTLTLPASAKLTTLKIGHRSLNLGGVARDYVFRCHGTICDNLGVFFAIAQEGTHTAFLTAEHFSSVDKSRKHLEPFTNLRPANAVARQSGDRLMVINRVKL